MDKITRMRMKTLVDQLHIAMDTCRRLDLGTDPDGMYIGEMAADKLEDIMTEIGLLLDEDVLL
jgi:hypothetical protein